MKNSTYNEYYHLQEEIKLSLKGGLDGLESLFNLHINSHLKNGVILNHTDFKEFYRGKKIEFIGVKGEKEFENNNKIESLNFNNFFEKFFVFELDEFNVFFDRRNILLHTLYKLREFMFNEKFSENQKSLFLKELVSHLNLQITKSQEVKKSDNKILYDKLIYISNGYIRILNRIVELYSNYFTNDGQINTSSFNAEKSKTREDIFKNLTNGNQTKCFNEIDKKLKKEKYIDENYKWIKNDADFVRFYNYLEEKKIIRYQYEATTVGIKLLRQLYYLNEESNLNPPNKRKKQNRKSKARQFNKFLD